MNWKPILLSLALCLVAVSASAIETEAVPSSSAILSSTAELPCPLLMVGLSAAPGGAWVMAVVVPPVGDLPDTLEENEPPENVSWSYIKSLY